MITKETLIQLLIDSNLVTTELEGNHWFENEKIPSYGDMSASDLFAMGRADEILSYIKRITDGGYT